MNNAAINVCLQVQLFKSLLSQFFVCLPRSGIVDHSITNLLRACHSVFHCGYPALYPLTAIHKEFQALHVLANTCSLDLGVIALLMGMRWYRIMVLD